MSDKTLELQAAKLANAINEYQQGPGFVKCIQRDILAALRQVRRDALNDAGVAQMFTVLDPEQHMLPVGTATLKRKVTR
jgi:hypothetical protein